MHLHLHTSLMQANMRTRRDRRWDQSPPDMPKPLRNPALRWEDNEPAESLLRESDKFISNTAFLAHIKKPMIAHKLGASAHLSLTVYYIEHAQVKPPLIEIKVAQQSLGAILRASTVKQLNEMKERDASRIAFMLPSDIFYDPRLITIESAPENKSPDYFAAATAPERKDATAEYLAHLSKIKTLAARERETIDLQTLTWLLPTLDDIVRLLAESHCESLSTLVQFLIGKFDTIQKPTSRLEINKAVHAMKATATQQGRLSSSTILKALRTASNIGISHNSDMLSPLQDAILAHFRLHPDATRKSLGKDLATGKLDMNTFAIKLAVEEDEEELAISLTSDNGQETMRLLSPSPHPSYRNAAKHVYDVQPPVIPPSVRAFPSMTSIRDDIQALQITMAAMVESDRIHKVSKTSSTVSRPAPPVRPLPLTLPINVPAGCFTYTNTSGKDTVACDNCCKYATKGHAGATCLSGLAEDDPRNTVVEAVRRCPARQESRRKRKAPSITPSLQRAATVQVSTRRPTKIPATFAAASGHTTTVQHPLPESEEFFGELDEGAWEYEGEFEV